MRVLSGRLLACLWLRRQITELRQHSAATTTTTKHIQIKGVCVCVFFFTLNYLFPTYFSSVSAYFSLFAHNVFLLFFFLLRFYFFGKYIYDFFVEWITYARLMSMRKIFEPNFDIENFLNQVYDDDDDYDHDDNNIIASIRDYWEIYPNDRRLFSRRSVGRPIGCFGRAFGCLDS